MAIGILYIRVWEAHKALHGVFADVFDSADVFPDRFGIFSFLEWMGK